uniref:ESPR-type extended signal peptide-containing protein n=1 Tax=uncultured Megasphaera sp. TaxID=165188 RepID=UPI002617748D
MNKIFKVIWSKSRNCYVVASELAKGRTKAASTGDKAKRLALAAITALMLLPVGGFSYAAINSATINGTSVITGTQKDADNISGTVMKATNNARDIGNLKTAMQSVENELAQHQMLIDNLDTDKLTLSSDNTLQKETYDSATKTTTTTDVTGLKVAGPVSAKSASISGTLSAGGAVNAGSVNSRGNITAVGTIAGQTVTASGTMKGKDLIGTNSIISQGTIAATGNISSQATVGAKEIVSQTNITAKNKVVGMQGVVDNTLTSGNYVTAGNTVGENIVALDTQVKANADQFTTDKTSTALHVSKDGNLIVGTKENQTVKDLKIRGQLTSGSISTGDITSSGDVSVAGKVEAEAVYDDTTKTGNYVVQTNSVGANLSALDTQVKSNADAITAEATAREAGDTALNERITNVKEYLEKQTSDNYVSKTDAAVQDGAIVKADKTIGENVTNLDAALAKETAARIGADAAQDKVIQQVNQNMVDGFNTINKNMADGFTALNQADAKEAQERAAADAALDDKITAETSARVAADTKLVEAVNSGLSLSDDNVLQKNTTTIDAQGNVTTSKTDANEMILNKGNDNQITLNENGIKVGTNSTVVDKDGVYTGGDTYSEAKAAMSADGKIKGANGAFTVDENGNVTSKATITGETVTDGKGASMSNGTVTGKTLTDGIATITNGNINTSGTITGGTVTSTGNISAVGDIHAGGAITGASASIQGALTAGSATITGDLTAGGAIQGKSISDGTATMQNGNLTGVKNLSAETITTSGNATIGGDL